MIYLFLTAVLLHAHLSGTEASLNAEFTTLPCPGDQISFNCTVSALDSLWTVPPPVTQISITSTQGTIVTPPYTAEVISVDENMLTSRLTTAAVDGVTIGCGSLTTGSVGSFDIQTLDPPTSPSGVIHSISSTLEDGLIVSVQWIRNSEADNYLVTISPTAPFLQPSAVVTDAVVSLTVTTETDYTISIVATNCARNSTPIDYQFRVANCSQPSFNPGVVFNISSTVETATVSYGCSNTPNSDISTCGADRLWTPDTTLLVCSTQSPSVTCGVPQSPVNGTVSSTLPSSPLGTVVIFQCNDGLLPNDVMTSTCTDEEGVGVWRPDTGITCRTAPGTPVPLSTVAAVGITFGVTVVVFTILGFLAGLLVMYFIITRKKAVYSPTEGQANIQPTIPAGPVYEDVLPAPKEEIELNTNNAYGPVRQ